MKRRPVKDGIGVCVLALCCGVAYSAAFPFAGVMWFSGDGRAGRRRRAKAGKDRSVNATCCRRQQWK